MLVDKNAVLQVIGSLLKHPQYLSETEKYSLTTDDFTSSFEKIIFAAIYNLYLNGAEKITRVDIDNYLKDYPSSYETFTREKGLDYLNDAEILAQEDNFPYYYKRIKKFSCLRQLKKMGYDVSKIYNDNPLNIEAQKANEKFDNLEVSDIFTLLKKNLMQVESSFNSSESNETRAAINGLENLIENLQNEPEIGPKLQGDIFNTIVKGARKGKYYIRSMGTGVGKAIPNYTIVPTPNGYRRVDEIKVGDYLFDRSGNLTKVLGVYPQKEKKKIFKVYFKSGRVAECCDEHLWSYYTESNKEKLITKSLREIYEESKINNFKYNDFYLYQIPIIKKAKLPERVFGISPYIAGYTNGDKNLREEYLFGSIAQRVELLKGLLAAKGYSYGKSKTIDYYTVNEELKDNFIGLISSLGYLPNLYIEHKEDEQITYHIKFSINNSEYKEGVLTDPIINIEETNNYTDMTCFYVDNDEHLFAAGKTWWITHNTRSLVGDACNMAYPIRFNSSLGYWIKEGNSEKILFVATEQNFDEIQTLILAYLTDINEDKIITGNYSEEEKDRIRKAIYIMNEYKDNFLISRMPNPDVTQIKAIIRQNYLVHDIQNVFYDYIFSSPSLLSEFRDLKIREDVALLLLSTALKDLAVELNIFIMTATQLNAEAEEKKGIKNQSVLRGSKSIADSSESTLKVILEIIKVENCWKPLRAN